MPEQLIEDLRALRELLSERSRWTRGAYARDEHENKLNDPLAEEATCWCLSGAIKRVAKSMFNERQDVLRQAVRKHCHMAIPIFNDRSEHADVLRVIDLALAEAHAS